MTEGKTGREVAEECGLLGEHRRERTTTKGRQKQIKPNDGGGGRGGERMVTGREHKEEAAKHRGKKR